MGTITTLKGYINISMYINILFVGLFYSREYHPFLQLTKERIKKNELRIKEWKIQVRHRGALPVREDW